MAVEKCNTIPIEIIRGEVGTWTEYIGSKEQLIEAGFSEESYFPEGKKRLKYSPGLLDWTVRKIKGNRFTLRKHHAYRPLPESKDTMYSSPALFKSSAISHLGNFIRLTANHLSGKHEFNTWGETTIWLDESSMREVLCAGARLIESIKAAKVKSRKQQPHLSIVK